MVQHGLNETNVVVSVFEYADGGAEVECDVRRGQWSAGTTAAGTGVTSGTLANSIVANSDPNWVSIIFATAPADSSKYRVTVIG